METVLGDKNQFPAKEIIYSHIGKNRILWDSLFDFIHSDYPDISEQWRYYNDGKSWLMKVTRKSKTIFWLSLIKSTFRITFYFTDKTKKLISDSNISEELKDQFRDEKSKLRGITITFRKKKDIEYAKTLIALKLSIK